MTRVVLLLALLFGSYRFLLIHFGNSVSCFDSLFACVPSFHSDHSSPQNLGLLSCLTLVLSFTLVLAFLALGVFAFLAFVSIHSVDFHRRFTHYR